MGTTTWQPFQVSCVLLALLLLTGIRLRIKTDFMFDRMRQAPSAVFSSLCWGAGSCSPLSCVSTWQLWQIGLHTESWWWCLRGPLWPSSLIYNINTLHELTRFSSLLSYNLSFRENIWSWKLQVTGSILQPMVIAPALNYPHRLLHF